MHKLLIPVILIALVAAGCGTTEDGPIIAPDVNSRNLCNYNVSVESETRCMLDTQGRRRHPRGRRCRRLRWKPSLQSNLGALLR